MFSDLVMFNKRPTHTGGIVSPPRNANIMTRIASLLVCLLAGGTLAAQYFPPDPAGLERVIVERYYEADANDAGDVDGGTGLTGGAKTYRVYVDMLDGYKLLTVAGYVDHELNFNTTTTFFNNEDRGDSWARAINDLFLDQNTVAIDSWLAMGAASDAHWGVLKAEDPDGSIVGGVNNDGGSNGVPGGLLINNAATAGIPLTGSDGLFLDVAAPPQTVDLGVAPTIFNEPNASSYVTDNWGWGVLGGIRSPLPGNKILIGQFTTDGVFSYCLNIWVQIPVELRCPSLLCHENLEYYATLLESDTASIPGSVIGDNRFTIPSLCFSSDVGEIDCLGNTGGSVLPGTACDDDNPDTTNDNYTGGCICAGNDCEDVQGGDALPGSPCDDGNPETVGDVWASSCTCSGVTGINDLAGLASMITVSPNPTNDLLWIGISDLTGQVVTVDLRDASGRKVQHLQLGMLSGNWKGNLDMSAVEAGIYFLEFRVDGQSRTERIVKQ